MQIQPRFSMTSESVEKLNQAREMYVEKLLNTLRVMDAGVLSANKLQQSQVAANYAIALGLTSPGFNTIA